MRKVCVKPNSFVFSLTFSPCLLLLLVLFFALEQLALLLSSCFRRLSGVAEASAKRNQHANPYDTGRRK
jgi:hypothetical protein